MNPTTSSVDAAELLAHVAWVQRLARALVGDPSLADDLAQETLRVGIERPPDATARGPRLRGWLARVARRLAIDRARSDARRGAREITASRAAAAERRAGESPLDVVERSARQQRVVEAVMALAEPYRTTVLLRFFDELPTREIAARTNANEAVVRQRIARALAQLRERLDREFGSATREWAGLLLAAPGAAALATKGKVALAATAALLIGGAAWHWTRSDPAGGEGERQAVVATADDAATRASDAALQETPAPVAVERSEIAAAPPASVAEPAARRVVVEVVTPGGAPCRQGLLSASWRRTPEPSVDVLVELQDHSLMTPRTEPLRTLELPIAGEQTIVELPSDASELQIEASVEGLRPSDRVVLSDLATPGDERVRLVVGEPRPDDRFGGVITVDGRRCVPRGLTVAVGISSVVEPRRDVRIDTFAATWELAPRPQGAFYLWITSDETVPRRVDVGASEDGVDLALERGRTLELTLLDLASGEPAAGVDLLVMVELLVVARYGDSPWGLRGERTVTARSDEHGIATVVALPKRPYEKSATGRRLGSVEVRLDQATIAAEPLWQSEISVDSPDPLRATLRIDRERSRRRVTGLAPASCRGARFDGDPPAIVAIARRDADGGLHREGGLDGEGNPTGVAIDADGRFEWLAYPATTWLAWAERGGQRLSEVATVEVGAEDVGPIALLPRRGGDVTLRIRGVTPPESVALTIEDRGREDDRREVHVAADPTGGELERRVTLDGATTIAAELLGRDGSRRASQRVVVDPATQPLVVLELSAPTTTRRIELLLRGVAIREGGDASVSFLPLDAPGIGPDRWPSARLGASGRTATPIELPPGRWIWSFHSRLLGVIGGVVDVTAAEPGALLRLECDVEPAGDELLARGFAVEAFGDDEVPALYRSMLTWRAGGARDPSTSVWVPVAATVALREPGRPVVVTLEGAKLPDDAVLRMSPFDRGSPFEFELHRIALDANGRGDLPVAVAPGRWFWCVANATTGLLGGVIDVPPGAAREPLELHGVLEERTGPEGKSGFLITAIGEVAVPRGVGPGWFPRSPQFEGEASYLVPVGAITQALDPSSFGR